MELTLYGIRTFGSILAIVLHMLAYSYLEKLERIDCPCAQDKKLYFMRVALAIMIVFLVVNMFMPIPNIKEEISKGMVVFTLVQLFMAALAMMFYIYVIIFVNRIVREKCQCSEDVRREITYIYAVFQLAMLGIMVLLALINGTVFYANPLKTMLKTGNRVISDMKDPVKGLRRSVDEAKSVAKKAVSRVRSLSPGRGRSASRGRR